MVHSVQFDMYRLESSTYGILYRVWDHLDSYDPLSHSWWWKEDEIVRVSIP